MASSVMQRTGIAMAIGLAILTGCASGDAGDDAMLKAMKADSVAGPVIAASPENEAAFKAAIASTHGERDDSRRVHVMQLNEAVMQRHVSAREGHLDDQAVSRLGGMFSNMLLRRAASGGDCQAPLASYVTRDERRAFLAETVKADPSFTPRIAPSSEMAATLSTKGQEIASRAGMTQEELQAVYSSQVPAPAATTCRVMAASVGVLAAMPPAEGAPLIRSMTKF